MKKRLTAFLLAVLMMVSLLPISVVAAADADYEAEIRTAVTKMIKDYAKKVYQPEADDDALVDFLVHGFFGARQKMTLNEKSAMTAALFNSGLLQEALTNGITAGIIRAQELQKDVLYVSGATNWHNYAYSYSATGYFNKGKDANTYSGSVGSLTGTKTIYGDAGYQGARNENDELQELLSGSLWTYYDLEKVQMVNDRAVYKITVGVADTFDFTTSYDDLAQKGYDTSKDDRLVNLGFLLTHVGLDEFDWSFQTTLEVEVPFNCDHTTHNYRWVYDGETVTVNSQDNDEFTLNPTQKLLNAKGKDGAIDTYRHQVDTPVILKHDRPWVMEWDQLGLKNHQFSPGETSSNVLPTVHANATSSVQLLFNRQVTLDNGEKKTLTHYMGVKLREKIKYNSKHHYTCTLENVIHEDGSNMFCLTVYDHELDEVVISAEPMNDLWYKLPDEEASSLKDPDSDLANGMDIIINYIGNKSCGLSYPTTEIELRIWEAGKNPAPDVGVPTEPTCTRVGGNLHKCSDCGGEYFTDAIPALGHSYGEYVSDNNATCTENGTQTRICTRCGVKDTATVPNTALGHDFGEYLYNKDASCTEDGTQSRNCSRCTAAETKDAPDTATGHSHQPAATAPTCTAQGYTTYTCHCSDSYKADYVDATGHSYQMTIIAPTCTEQGYTLYTCHCGDTYKADYTDETGHSPVIDAAVPASCIGNGLTEGSHCEVCGYVIKAQNTVIGGTHLKDEGTIIKEATYETPGTVMYQCIYCGEKSYVVLPKLDKPEPVVNPFTDVKESDWFYNPVMWAYENNVTGGKTATTFAPNEGCTRAQVVTFLWAANGKPMPESAENLFTDIKEGDWYYNAVLWAVENGITGGTSEHTFSPNATCTRAQIATFLWAAQGKHAVSDLSGFSDVAAADWYATPVIWAKEQGITDGIGGGKFGPNDTCTRAQVVTFLNKVYG